MKTLQTKPGVEVLMIEIPIHSKDYIIVDDCFSYRDTVEWSKRYIDLPEGQWQLHSIWPDTTEEQAAEIVQCQVVGVFTAYRDYGIDNSWIAFDPLDSLCSAIKATGMDPEKRIVLLTNKTDEK